MIRHSHEGGNPGTPPRNGRLWIPASAEIQAVIPRAVAESMRGILIDRRMDSATTLRSAQNDGLKCLKWPALRLARKPFSALVPRTLNAQRSTLNA